MCLYLDANVGALGGGSRGDRKRQKWKKEAKRSEALRQLDGWYSRGEHETEMREREQREIVLTFLPCLTGRRRLLLEFLERVPAS